MTISALCTGGMLDDPSAGTVAIFVQPTADVLVVLEGNEAINATSPNVDAFSVMLEADDEITATVTCGED